MAPGRATRRRRCTRTATLRPMPRTQSLTVVIAAHNEEAALPILHPRLMRVLDGLDLETRVIYVDDGSRDGTWELLRRFAEADPRVGVVRLARNFGKEVALTAGLDLVEADAAVVLDADGQDPPELIPEFVARWREGWDVVYGTRISREGESWFKRFTAAGFYRVMARLSDTAATAAARALCPVSLPRRAPVG